MVNANEPTPLKLTLPLGVWTLCTSVLTLLASVGLAIFVAFVGIQSFLATDKGQADLSRFLWFILFTGAVGLPGLWVCLGYYRITWQAGYPNKVRRFWAVSGFYHLFAMIILKNVFRGAVGMTTPIEIPSIPFWILSLLAASVSFGLALGLRGARAVAQTP
jgi:hypothetical protein